MLYLSVEGLGILSFSFCSFTLCSFALCSFALCSFALLLFALLLFALELFAISLFALSLFALSLFALCSLLFALSLFLSTVYPSYYRATVSDSLPSVLTKEREWANRSHHHHRHEWLTRDSSKSLSKMSHSFEKMHTFCIFLTIFYFIFPLFIK